MSDPLGDEEHVSPLVRSLPIHSSSAPSPSHDQHAPSPPAEHDFLYHRKHGPARAQSQLSSSGQHSETIDVPSGHNLPNDASSALAEPASSSSSSTSPTATPSSTKRRRADTPQLSERDSIFATHYLAADSGASTPTVSAAARLVKGDAITQDVTASVSLPGPLSSKARIASSLQTSDIQAGPHNMRMAPESAPYSSSSPAPPLSRDGVGKQQPEDYLPSPIQADGVEQDKEDWDRANERDKSKSLARRRRSDQQIQATLANEEPIGHARSRKASHYLGLFRENAKEKKQQRQSRERVKDVYGIEKELHHEDLPELDHRQRAIEPEVPHEKRERESEPRSVSQTASVQPLLPTSPTRDSVVVLSPTSEIGDAIASKSDDKVEWFSDSAPSGAYPIRLLEEIRDHPVAKRHVKEDHRPSSPSAPAQTQPRPSLTPSQTESITAASDKPLTLPPEAGIYDSDKEHISAATYFPHQAPSPDDIHGQEKSGDSFDDLGDPAISPRTTPTEASKPNEHLEKFELDRRASVAAQAPQRVKSPENLVENEPLPGPPPRRVDTGLSTVSEAEYESVDDDADDDLLADELADVDHTPTATPRVRPTKFLKKSRRQRSPLGAVELKPYKHQVGGHTKVFSFSKQAICKELNNRENSFYEVIERRHPELLDFMPRYLGVLNVTYSKAKRKPQQAVENETTAKSEPGANGSSTEQTNEQKEPQERVISHGKNFSANDETVARVIYANNLHIIPSNLFPNLPLQNGAQRPATAGGAVDAGSATGPSKSAELQNGHVPTETNKNSLPSRPSISDYPSWGATTVNLKLKERVMRDVFSPPTVYQKHNRRVRKPLTHNSFHDPKLQRSDTQANGRSANKDALLSAALLKSASDLTHVSSHEDVHRGGSAPTHHSSLSNLRDRTSIDSTASDSAVPSDRHVSRRRSDQGLQRLQCDIDSNSRSGLNYYEDEEFSKAKEDDIFAMDLQNGHKTEESVRNASSAPDSKIKSTPLRPKEQTVDDMLPLSQQPSQDQYEAPVPSSPMPTPVNPLQAQLHTDERVKHFLLLEDLTANMMKPCVLDLKMGTRQYGIEANLKKRTSQRMKCKMTTSRQLGVRLCGMQVWNVKKQEYAFEDKYAGRDLHAGKEFQAALRRFLYDGVSNASVTRHIPVLLDKLSRLEQIVSQLPRYRFYASSLLLIYDGADLPSQKSIEQLDKEDKGSAEQATQTAAGGDSKNSNLAAKERQLPASSIDIRLVDFANCVTSQTKRLAEAPSPPAHPNQPDSGYIKGLRSLRSYLQRIWMEINTEEAGSWVERGEGEAMAIAQKGAGNADRPEGWRKAGDAPGDDGEVSE